MDRRISAIVVAGCALLVAGGCAPARSQGAVGAGGVGGKTGSGGTAGKGGSEASGGSVSSGGTSGSGGKSASGGADGNGGSSAAGGSAARGGSGSSGGAAGGGRGGAGGSAGAGGSVGTVGSGAGGAGGNAGSVGSGAGGSSASASCSFTQSSSTSTKIPTVGIVTWSTTLSGVKSAKIDFGLTTSYGYTAPVDLTQTNYRTLLLGMKQNKTYHYRITATGGSGDCASSDYTITTGAFPNGLLPQITVSTANASALAGGFLILGQFVQGFGGSGSGSPAYILDADNEFVWAYSFSGDATGVRMDYAGTHMWINSANVPNGSTRVHRISMDGMTDEDLSSKFTGLSHQLTVLPDETVAFYAYGSNNCDDIKEYTPSSGNVRTVVNSAKAIAGSGSAPSACHLNNIEYSKDDDALVFSDLDSQTITKIKRSDGSTVWILNSSRSTFTGDTWKGGQHGIHLLGLDDLVIFNNNSTVNMGSFGFGGGGSGSAGGDGSGSIAMEIKLDLSGKKATKAWQYKASPGIDNSVMGDVQRLPNGNTVVGFSTSGVLHEVDSKGTVLQTLTWKNLTQFGYITKRPTLYGPPPR